MKKVLIISTSLRKGGNSEILAEQFANGARDAGNAVEIVSLIGKNISFCKGCLSCQKTQKCTISDDATAIVEKMNDVDVIAFATPIYFYEMSGQMKTLLDRTNESFTKEHSFQDIYLLATAADTSKSSMDGAIKGLQGWVDCFDNVKIANVLYGVGVTNIGEVNGNAQLLKQAYEMGAKV